MFEEKPFVPPPELEDLPEDPPKVYLCRRCLRRSTNPDILCEPVPS